MKRDCKVLNLSELIELEKTLLTEINSATLHLSEMQSELKEINVIKSAQILQILAAQNTEKNGRYNTCIEGLDFSTKGYIKVPLPCANNEWTIVAWHWTEAFIRAHPSAYVHIEKDFDNRFIHINCTSLM